uniref:Uncharacterized protein n=1 Tax=Cacopsylla melanoneura TaxID=428564 RepID=A0A8D8WWF9_9HEMI
MVWPLPPDPGTLSCESGTKTHTLTYITPPPPPPTIGRYMPQFRCLMLENEANLCGLVYVGGLNCRECQDEPKIKHLPTDCYFNFPRPMYTYLCRYCIAVGCVNLY